MLNQIVAAAKSALKLGWNVTRDTIFSKINNQKIDPPESEKPIKKIKKIPKSNILFYSVKIIKIV